MDEERLVGGLRAGDVTAIRDGDLRRDWTHETLLGILDDLKASPNTRNGTRSRAA